VKKEIVYLIFGEEVCAFVKKKYVVFWKKQIGVRCQCVRKGTKKEERTMEFAVEERG
jgi:hypothetical protein